MCVGASKEEVMEKLKTDIYAESKVWDFSKVSHDHDADYCQAPKHSIILTCLQVQIYPYKCAIRYP